MIAGWTTDILSMILVGALWGCTNPLLRKGSVEGQTNEDTTTPLRHSSFLKRSLTTFFKFRVWLPYALNQSGSLVFYILLAHSNLSMAVPTCNALALVFSFLTSWYLGEPFTKPLQTLLGASLIMIGIAICVSSSYEEVIETKTEKGKTNPDL